LIAAWIGAAPALADPEDEACLDLGVVFEQAQAELGRWRLIVRDVKLVFRDGTIESTLGPELDRPVASLLNRKVIQNGCRTVAIAQAAQSENYRGYFGIANEVVAANASSLVYAEPEILRSAGKLELGAFRAEDREIRAHRFRVSGLTGAPGERERAAALALAIVEGNASE